jgi:hypothetical protein
MSRTDSATLNGTDARVARARLVHGLGALSVSSPTLTLLTCSFALIATFLS